MSEAPDPISSVEALEQEAASTVNGPTAASEPPRKGPLSFLSGSLTSLGLGWVCLQLAQRVVAHYASHPPQFSSRLAQSIGVAVKTLVVGMTFLATFTFAFVGLGLFLVFLRSLVPARPAEEA